MIAIAVSIFNQKVSDGLLAGCLRALNDNSIDKNNIDIFRVPGAFELPPLVKKLSESSKHDCIIALGCIIKGETDHYDFICSSVSNGLMQLNISGSTPVIFCVLTDHKKSQSIARSGGEHGNKGAEAAIAAIKMASFK